MSYVGFNHLLEVISTTYDSDLTQTLCLGPLGEDTGLVFTMHLCTISAGLLASVSATLRWNDGIDDRSHVLNLSLAALSNYAGVIVPVYCANAQSVTIETNLTGTAEYGLMLMVTPVY